MIDYINLMKPRIMFLVVFTAVAGLAAGSSMSGLSLHPVMAGVSVLAVALGSGAAGAINMWYDADIDAVMSRTASRPVPAGLVPRDEALALGIIMSGVAVLLMWLSSNWLAAILLAFSIFYYGVIYTIWLKRSTPQNIVIGGGAGAFPPVIGWAAVTGSMPLDAWILFGIIFLWTPPHFWALSLLAHREYAKVSVPMLPVTHGARATRHQIVIYTLLLVLISMAPVLTGLGGALYAATAAVLGLAFTFLSVRLLWSRAGEEGATGADMKQARTTFAFSIFYLFGLFGAILAEHAGGLYLPLTGGS